MQNLRNEWKALDQQHAGVPKALWERFDRACEKAYAPAARHFAEQAAKRKEARKGREEFIAAAAAHAPTLLAEPRDWRAIERWLRETEHKWREGDLGSVEPKAWKSFDTRFRAALAPARDALADARTEAKARRVALIEEATALAAKAMDRDAPSQVKAIQARWQAQAKEITLLQRDERALWDQFRAACDAVFQAREAKRKEEGDKKHEGRRALEEICAQLEQLAQATDKDEQELRRLLRESSELWRQSTRGPNAAPRGLESRFANAKAAVEGRAVDALARQGSGGVADARRQGTNLRNAGSARAIGQRRRGSRDGGDRAVGGAATATAGVGESDARAPRRRDCRLLRPGHRRCVLRRGWRMARSRAPRSCSISKCSWASKSRRSFRRSGSRCRSRSCATVFRARHRVTAIRPLSVSWLGARTPGSRTRGTGEERSGCSQPWGADVNDTAAGPRRDRARFRGNVRSHAKAALTPESSHGHREIEESPQETGATEEAFRRSTTKPRSVVRKHEVKAKLANFELVKAGSSLNLEVFANDEKIGELEIGRGSLFWTGGTGTRASDSSGRAS